MIFELRGRGLVKGIEYGATFTWEAASGGIQGGISNERADDKGVVTFPLAPAVLTAIGKHNGPGTLTLEVTRADGTSLTPPMQVVEPIA
jgi:hypothetical protein